MIHCRLGILGHRISYSQSPRIHKISGDFCDLDSVTTTILDFEPHQLSEVAEVLQHKQITAFNITTPYKKLSCIQKMIPTAPSPWMFVNTATFDPRSDQWQLACTDGLGFISSLKASIINLKSITHLVILGMGGALCGTLQTLFDPRVQDTILKCSHDQPLFSSPLNITILWRGIKDNYRARNAQKFSDDLCELSDHKLHIWIKDFHIEHMTQVLKDHHTDPKSVLIIQATPLPHQHDSMTPWIQALDTSDHLDALGGCMDMCYHPPSQLKSLCHKWGLGYGCGWHMLLAQAKYAQQIWWHKSPSLEWMKTHITQRSSS